MTFQYVQPAQGQVYYDENGNPFTVEQRQSQQHQQQQMGNLSDTLKNWKGGQSGSMAPVGALTGGAMGGSMFGGGATTGIGGTLGASTAAPAAGTFAGSVAPAGTGFSSTAYGAGSTMAGGAGAGGGMGSAMAAAGPWALLAAAIIANESEAKSQGRRRQGKQYYEDLATGRVVEQDFDYYGEKIGGPMGKLVKGIGQLNPASVFGGLKDMFQ